MAAGTCCVSAAAAQTSGQKSTTAPHNTAKGSHKSSSDQGLHTSSSHAASKASTPKSARTGTSKSSSKKKSKRVKGQAAPTAERISEIQEALARKGTFAGTPTGKWDDGTVDAIRKFQASNGLNPSGKLDAPTLQRLGLGSQTAGLAAPTPPPNSANRLLNPASSPPEPSEPRE
jgi:peptidoglycan hydrolase-like protein with peptidoglycan-binding domain